MTPLFLLLGGTIGAAIVSMLIALYAVPYSERIHKIASYCYVGVVCCMMAVAAVLLLSAFMSETPHAPGAAFSVLPPWVAGVHLLAAFLVAGFCRGLSLQKHKRWV